jgi:hypothetical protein
MVNLDTMGWTELGEAMLTFADLAEYARNKRLAVVHRADGKILEASHYESQCDILYVRLPAWARW